MTQDTGATLLLGVVGSTAYGLAGEGSDEDRLGVYLAPPADVLGLRGPSVLTGSRVTTDPDVTVHELYKFTTLALKGNPTVSELLWLDGYVVETEGGRALREVREAFLSTAAVRGAYGGYALQQSRKLLSRHGAGQRGFSSDLAKRTAKHGRHCLRLLRQARGLLATGHLAIDMSAQREELFAAGELAASDPEAFAALFESEFAALETVDSVLPEHPDHARVERVVVELRLASMR
ncbi:nucleotidyltransferase domain-containing protein [Yinghuangia seranimata]|uniref:nucleotidyltransferase domain-containing protein n=1 Tax=Yinghuangia seranimata TaxID=408067 RepID=UPI00248AE494|nr:nucleotidyltransferase domain-containing protein [Yinghuangia seranimata]MDI2127264.1 nucleotidyltransferase domain-containing protein [Yinghuangia seranimata]MDI2132209.1 nucleotidyltransferase domain-containing protein [Yinghuangia seranimata]